MFTESYARGGGNRYMIDLANAVADDFEHFHFVSNPGGIYAEDLARFKKCAQVGTLAVITRDRLVDRFGHMPGVVHKLFSASLLLCEPIMLISNVLLFRSFFERTQPSQFIACNGGYPASQGCLAAVFAARLCGIPAIMSVVSMPSKRRGYAWFYEALVDMMLWRFTRRIIVNSHAIGAALRSTRGTLEDRLVVVHNGIDDVGASSPRFIPGTLVIGCVARLDRMKGILVLIDAYAKLVFHRSNIHLVLAGEGDASVEVKSRVHERALDNKVTLLGHFIDNVDELLRGFDIFAFPSLWEGLPYSLIEAMRAERAIVASRVGGVPEAIADGIEGLLVEPGNVEALFAALLRMIDDAALRRACASSARARYLRDFSLSEMHRRARAAILEAHA